jgi:hypothetical protein
MKGVEKNGRVHLNNVGALTLPLEVAEQNWFFKYKVYHIFFWCVYHYIWAVVNGGGPLEVLTFIFSSPKFIFYVIFQAIAVYFNLYFLIPRYLEKGRYGLYLSYLVLTIFITASLIVSGYYWTAYLKQTTLQELYGQSNFSHYFLRLTLPSTLTSMMLAMSIKLAKKWIQAKRKEQLLEKEKLETELKFLRSQFNPHFLFNTINSIFVLIHKNQNMASEALAKFSDLLRYQLYECNEQEIPLRQEITYLENYIELEKLRQDSKSLKLSIDLDQHHAQDLTIAPFVLMPFVENAFKHISMHTNQPNWIRMKLSFDQGQLQFIIANSVSSHRISREVIRHAGIGLKNVQRRLNLIYPAEHDLIIKHDDDQFYVKLNLRLHQFKINEGATLTVSSNEFHL